MADGFLSIPRWVWLEHLLTHPGNTTTSPAYPLTHYRVADKRMSSELEPGELEALVGRAVMWEDVFPTPKIEVGTLVRGRDDFALGVRTFVDGGFGSSIGPLRLDTLSWIGEAEFLPDSVPPHRPDVDRLTLEMTCRMLSPLVCASEVDGDVLRLEIVAFNSRYIPRIPRSTVAMAMVCAPIADLGGVRYGTIRGSSPLAETLRMELSRLDPPALSDLMSVLADGYIMDHDLIGPDQSAWPEVDDSCAERFESLPWPRWTATIRVSDPAWLEHFPVSEYSYSGSHMGEPRKWSGPPARYGR